MDKSQLLLNLETSCFNCYVLIDPIESVRLPSSVNYVGHINYFGHVQDGDIQDGGIQDGVSLFSCVQAPICPRIYIRPAAIFEGDKYNYRCTTRQPPRNHCPGGRRHPHVYEFATERLVHCMDGT